MFAFPSARAAPGQRVLLQCRASLRSLLGGQSEQMRKSLQKKPGKQGEEGEGKLTTGV